MMDEGHDWCDKHKAYHNCKKHYEPHEVRGPYEAYVVMTKRKDGKAPGLEKAIASKHGDCPTAMFDCVDEAYLVRDEHNSAFSNYFPSLQQHPYAVFKVHVTVIE